MQFALNIKKLREERNLSQKDIADHLGVTRQAVNSYECGRREPDYQTLIKLADFFRVTVDFLLGRSSCKGINNLEEYENSNKAYISGDAPVLNAEIDHIEPELLKWITDEDNLDYIEFARYIQTLELPLKSVKSILDVMKSLQDGA